MNARETHTELPKSHLVLPNFTCPDLPAERLSSVLRDTQESYGIIFSLQVRRTGSDWPVKETQGKKKEGIPVCSGKWVAWRQEWL